MSFYFVEFDAIMKIGESVCSVTSSLKFKYFKYYTFYQNEFNIISNYFFKIKKLPKMVISQKFVTCSIDCNSPEVDVANTGVGWYEHVKSLDI